ncbi:hypothetical protein A0H81_13248 [Grifola frondosa]|uniref:Uncharacterized protein n=1 Tax=Grifola frondosa TaxID=5627 RepID=A0A1C7LPR0_GRIFR|nr:hypothetical protein A0H81_13248 [Grifola frondosa]
MVPYDLFHALHAAAKFSSAQRGTYRRCTHSLLDLPDWNTYFFAKGHPSSRTCRGDPSLGRAVDAGLHSDVNYEDFGSWSLAHSRVVDYARICSAANVEDAHGYHLVNHVGKVVPTQSPCIPSATLAVGRCTPQRYQCIEFRSFLDKQYVQHTTPETLANRSIRILDLSSRMIGSWVVTRPEVGRPPTISSTYGEVKVQRAVGHRKQAKTGRRRPRNKDLMS